MGGITALCLLLGAALILCARPAVGQTVNLFGVNSTGDGTYYGDAQGSGTCSFAQSDAQTLPWASGTAFRVAMDQPYFFGSQSCGMCLAMHGTGPGSGADAIPLTTQYVLVSNLCPECKAGDLDQEIAGDGRWKIEWHPVQCAVGSTPFVYSFQGSNPYYIKMQVSNHRVPVAGVQWFFSGTWYDMSRSGDNYFIIQAINSQPLILPAQIKVTSIFGDIVIDTVATSSPLGRVIGNVQFPVNNALDTVPDPNAVPSGPTPAPASATPAPPVGTPAPDTAMPSTSQPADVPAPVPPPTDTPMAPADTPAPAAPPSDSSTPPDTPAPAGPPSVPANPPPDSPPTAPAPPSDGSSAWDAAAAQSQHLTPAQIAQLTPGYTPAPSKDGKTVLAPYAQCGGINNAPSPAESGNAPWNSSECSQDFQCLSNSNQWFWQCVPVPEGLNPSSLAKRIPLTTALAAALNTNTTCTRYIPSYGQCGGSAGGCYGADCLDAVWSKSCCAPNNKGEAFTCVRQSAMKWMCQLESLVASSAFAKTVRKGAYGASLGSVTALAHLQGQKATAYKATLASSLAAAQARPSSSDLTNLQSFANVVPHSSKGVVLQAAGIKADQIRSGSPGGTPSSNSSVISGEHIDTSNLKGVQVDPTTIGVAGIEASTPVGNFTIGQATRYIIAGISAESAGDNCTIWVGEGVQCGGQGGACHADSCVDQEWDGACCLHPLNRCQRFDVNYWECRTGSTFVSAE